LQNRSDRRGQRQYHPKRGDTKWGKTKTGSHGMSPWGGRVEQDL
jgi:hypothetical protein